MLPGFIPDPVSREISPALPVDEIPVEILIAPELPDKERPVLISIFPLVTPLSLPLTTAVFNDNEPLTVDPCPLTKLIDPPVDEELDVAFDSGDTPTKNGGKMAVPILENTV